MTALNDANEVAVWWFVKQNERDRVASWLERAAKAINDDNEQSYDNIERWFRSDANAVEDHRDGLIIDTLGMSPLETIAGKMFPRVSPSRAAESWLSGLRRQAATAGAFGILAARDPRDLGQRIAVGRLWQRMHLWLTDGGFAAQPMNQIHERIDRETQLELHPRFATALAELSADPDHVGLFTFRIGYPTKNAPPSPRRAVSDVMIHRADRVTTTH